MKRIFPICILILTLLLGCTGVPAQNASPAPAAAQDPTQEVVFVPVDAAEPSPVPTPVATPEPTATPAPSEPPTPEPTATPDPFVPEAVPERYRLRKGFSAAEPDGVVQRDADGAYFAYGSTGGTEMCFYPCDETGAVAPGEAPADVVCLVPVYAPTDTPKKDGVLKLAVYIPTQSVVAFRSENGEWLEERVMICSTGRKKNMTPRGSFRIYETYEFKRLGSKGNYCCGLYACRFKGAYLFHSVPISYDALNDVELGHRMMFMHKYEDLGRGASDGCVRLTVADAKWVYDNSQGHDTLVWITDREGPTPPAAPAVRWEAPYTDENGFGWDPTDPHPDNPYRLIGAEP